MGNSNSDGKLVLSIKNQSPCKSSILALKIVNLQQIVENEGIVAVAIVVNDAMVNSPLPQNSEPSN